jgi:DNA-binding GntR family transcriptional regulator
MEQSTTGSEARDSLLPLDPAAHLSLRDHVHRALRQAIITGAFHPGERVNERQLAERLGVSTTPVKEALRQLEADGMVETLPRRGVIIRFDFAWAEEMILARAALESMIARLAAQRIKEADRASLQEILTRMRVETDHGAPDELIALNEIFHNHIHKIARGQYLRRLIDRQQLYDSDARRVIHSDPAERERAFVEHSQIARAILARDPVAAETAMREHVLRAGETYLTLVFKKNKDNSGD